MKKQSLLFRPDKQKRKRPDKSGLQNKERIDYFKLFLAKHFGGLAV